MLKWLLVVLVGVVLISALRPLLTRFGLGRLPGDAQDAVRVSRELGLEGIVAKDADGGYDGGRRSRSWIKIKHHRAQEVVIGGWRTGNGNRSRSLGSPSCTARWSE